MEDIAGNFDLGLPGIFGGLGKLVEKLAEIAEHEDELTKTGEVRFEGKHGKDLKGIFGVTVKMGVNDKEPVVTPFGNIQPDEKSGESVVHEVREPAVDVFDEGDHALVVAEMPGIAREDLDLDLKEDILVVAAEKKHLKYRKEVLLPFECTREKMSVSMTNGVLEIRCER